jgi:superfamily II DNA or RNA helicase
MHGAFPRSQERCRGKLREKGKKESQALTPLRTTPAWSAQAGQSAVQCKVPFLVAGFCDQHVKQCPEPRQLPSNAPRQQPRSPPHRTARRQTANRLPTVPEPQVNAPSHPDPGTTTIAREDLLAVLAEAETRLLDLAKQHAEARRHVEHLRIQVSSADTREAQPTTLPEQHDAIPCTPAQKVQLFRSLFRGRDNVFPRLWVNTKKGTKGYSPACANEWVRGVCEKPRIKCGECTHQAFLAVDDDVVLGHLQGRHVIGVYPMLEDETCWFLAADFDKADWMQDVAAFVSTCTEFDVPAAVERSRSGNGAHVWIFFASPVPAAVARTMGCYLLTETMARRHELPLSSYDRFFPNQDTMPRGGFGNLIALPLQHRARELGNTVFVDANWQPHADQWGSLASLARVAPAKAHGLAREAQERGRVVGARMAEDPSEDNPSPWLRPPSRRAASVPITGPLPAQVRAVLAQQVFVEKDGLPSALLSQIKRLAAFQNPEFYKKQAMRLSTSLTPRVIGCAEETAQHLALPRGCMADLQELLVSHKVSLTLEDKRTLGAPLTVAFTGTLEPAQQKAAHDLMQHDVGVLVAPPGSGKTVIGAHLIAARGRNTLVLVHRTQLLDQWRAQLSVFLGVDRKKIGAIGGGKRKVTGQLDVAMIQSLVRQGKVDDLVAGYGHVLVDECHHVSAVSFEHVMREVHARYVTGLTATPHRRDGHHPILEFQLGPVRHAIHPKGLAGQRQIKRQLVARETTWCPADAAAQPKIQDIYRQLATDADRNRLIVDDVIQAVEQGRSPIVLTERRDHLEFFEAQLRGVVRNLLVLRGGMGRKQRLECQQRLADIPASEERLVLATGRFIGEGFDDARLDTLFLAMPVSWKGTLVQYAGRLHRRSAGKADVRIFDYVDRRVPMLARMFEKRMSGYRSMGYSIAAPETAPRTRTGDHEDRRVEYEQGTIAGMGDDALRT